MFELELPECALNTALVLKSCDFQAGAATKARAPCKSISRRKETKKHPQKLTMFARSSIWESGKNDSPAHRRSPRTVLPILNEACASEKRTGFDI